MNKNVTNIAIISRSGATDGGSSAIAASLARLLNFTSTYLAHHWVAKPDVHGDWFTYKLHGGRWLSLLQGACEIASKTIGLPGFLTPELFIHLTQKPFAYDLYHFHGLSSTFSPIALNYLVRRKPIVWTMHDCSPFTGGCYAPLDCQSLYTGCNNCPQLNKWPLDTAIDLTGMMQSYKCKILSKWPITTITPSRWLADEAMKVVNFMIPPTVIPNFVDTSIFKPIDKNIIRDILGLPRNRFIVLLSATDLSDNKKGNNLAIAAINKITPSPYIIAIGKFTENFQLLTQGMDVHVTGYIYNSQLIAQYYAAADVFMFPTLAESFGCVAIETMACGTPSIAFATGGVPEIITHNQNGWLVKTGDINGLVDGLNHIINRPETINKWRAYGIKEVNTKYTKEKFLAAHDLLYKKTLNIFKKKN